MRTPIKLFITTTVVAFALMLPAIAAHAQSGISSVSGSVADYTAASKKGAFVVIAGARVELEQAIENNPRKFTTTTDKRGVYSFAEIPYGDYVLRISSPGYRNYELKFFVDSDGSANITVLLWKRIS